MRFGALFSGGKDSTYATWLTSRTHELTCVITIFPMSESSYMFHYPNIQWTSLQAQAMDIPQIEQRTEGVKEIELDDLRKGISEAKSVHGISAVCTGALASVYQKERVERICSELGLECLSPLWQIEPEGHLRRIVKDGFVSIMVGVSALGLDESWLGRTIDDHAVDELVQLGRKYRFHPGLEGGEGETFVLDCPLFERRIEITESSKVWRRDSGRLDITNARLVSKESEERI